LIIIIATFIKYWIANIRAQYSLKMNVYSFIDKNKPG